MMRLPPTAIRFIIRPTLALVGLVFGSVAPLHAQTWGQYGVTVQQIPTALNFSASVLSPINNFGQVAGASNNFAAIYNYSSGTLQSLGSLGGTNSFGYGINNAGQVTGFSYTSGDAAYRAFLSNGTTMQDLGTLGGTNSYGYGINDAGQVTGYGNTSGNSTYRAFLSNGTTTQDLGTLGGSSSVGYGINNAGQVAGVSTTSGGAASRAFLSNGTTMQDLGALGGSVSVGYGINAAGQVAGLSYASGNSTYRAFLSNGTTMQDLGTLGGTYSYAYGISDAGIVTGAAQDASTVFRAALWQDTGTGYAAYTLDDLVNGGLNSGYLFDLTSGISDDGRFILASGSNSSDGTSGYYVLEAADAPPVTPTPEPATVLLLATGLAGVAVSARRRRVVS